MDLPLGHFANVVGGRVRRLRRIRQIRDTLQVLSPQHLQETEERSGSAARCLSQWETKLPAHLFPSLPVLETALHFKAGFSLILLVPEGLLNLNVAAAPRRRQGALLPNVGRSRFLLEG